MTDLTFFATAPNGMTDLLAIEIGQIGAANVKESRAGVYFEGTIEAAYRVCLWSRLANRVLLPLASFPANSPEALYAGVREIDWSRHLDATNTLSVDTNVSTSSITHSHYAALKIKDAIVDSFTDRGGERPSVDLDNPDLRINCYLFKDNAEIYLDLSGASLHQRNYRLESGDAPLKENLAAAILLRSRWPEVAADHGAFVDLMCGSGTLVIEAALMAADIAPGLTRAGYGFFNWKQHQDAIWDRLLAEANYRREKGLEKMPVLLGFDNDRRVLERAERNAERAGVQDNVRFVYQDVGNFRHDFPAKGLMVTNPPYGRRMSETGELPSLYRSLGEVMKMNLQGWKAAVFTEDQALGKHLAIRAEKLHTLFNGAISCKLIHFSIEPDQFFRDKRLPRRLSVDQLSEQAVMFRNRLTKNLKQIEKWARKEAVSCYRVYDADLPDYSAAVDVYGSSRDAGEKWICVQEYAAPSIIDPDKVKVRTSELLTVAQLVFEVDDDHLFYKTRARQRGENQYEKLEAEGRFCEVGEGAARLLVNFQDYLDTGLFLDHRPIRQTIFQEASKKRFLNLFGYTGAATVQAAKGGAVSTTTVDMSRTYLDWAARNLELNGINGKAHQLVQADCMKWLTEQNSQQYDLIFLDPPTFSNSKRMSDALDVQKDHIFLIEQSMRLLMPGGTLYFSTNLRNFKMDSGIADNFSAEDITDKTIAQDFKRRKNIHHCWRITHQ